MESNRTDNNDLVREYIKRGVVRVQGVLSSERLAEVKAAIDRYIREVLPGVPQADRTYEADGISVRNMWRLQLHDPFFKDLAAQLSILDFVRQILRGEPVVVGVETFNKPARTGSAVPWHQDNSYFCLAPPDALTVWIALDEATIENGPVYYAPGLHNEIQRHVPSQLAGNSLMLAEPPPIPISEQFCGTLAAGDALIHHCQIPHRSDANASDLPRCGLLIVFRGDHTKTESEMMALYQKAPKIQTGSIS